MESSGDSETSGILSGLSSWYSGTQGGGAQQGAISGNGGGMPFSGSSKTSNTLSSGASGYGGTQGGVMRALDEGDWNINQGSGEVGMSSKTLLIIAASAGAILWLLKRSA